MTWFIRARARPRPNLGHAPSAELVRLLADRDSWWRETAQRLLFERQDRSVVDVEGDGQGTTERAGTAARTLDASTVGGLDTESISLGLEDPEPRVREQAIRLAETRSTREPALLAKLLPMVVDKDPMVRLQLAFSLGEAKTISA